MFKYKSLHTERNWFSMLFSIMSRTLCDKESGVPLLYLKQTFGFHIYVYADKNRSNMLMEAKYKKATLYEWEVSEVGGKFLANVKSDLWGTAKMWGAEVMKITDRAGKEIMFLEREKKTVAKHIIDNMSDLYNPVHNYQILNSKKELVADIKGKHGIFKSFYDFDCKGGTEDEKNLALAVFAIMTLMLKK